MFRFRKLKSKFINKNQYKIHDENPYLQHIKEMRKKLKKDKNKGEK